MGLFKDLRTLIKGAKRLEADTRADRPGLGGLVAMANDAMADVSRQVADSRALDEHGVRATAVVIAARPTDAWVNRRPVIEVDLRIGADADAVEVTVRQAIHELYMARLVPGETVDVVTNPSDPAMTRLVFE